MTVTGTVRAMCVFMAGMVRRGNAAMTSDAGREFRHPHAEIEQILIVRGRSSDALVTEAFALGAKKVDMITLQG